MRRLSLGAIALTVLVGGLAEGRIVHRERSLYSTILVDRSGSMVCLQFSVRRNQRNQSCIDKDRPREMVFTYTRMMMAGLLFNDAPGRILVLGVGGGTLPMALAELYPQARIDAVEIDAAVVEVAELYFGFRPTSSMQVIVQDGRVFVKRAALRGRKYDLILLDAFNGDYIPEHLMTKEFLEETKSLLSDTGVLVANTFAISRLYDHESVTYAAVFDELINMRAAESANRVLIASARPFPDQVELRRRAQALAPRLRRYAVEPESLIDMFTDESDWDPSARVLTDQYAPANLLREG